MNLVHVDDVHREVHRYVNTNVPKCTLQNFATPAEVRELLHSLNTKKGRRAEQAIQTL